MVHIKYFHMLTVRCEILWDKAAVDPGSTKPPVRPENKATLGAVFVFVQPGDGYENHTLLQSAHGGIVTQPSHLE
jgi:hypothetical protein